MYVRVYWLWNEGCDIRMYLQPNPEKNHWLTISSQLFSLNVALVVSPRWCCSIQCSFNKIYSVVFSFFEFDFHNFFRIFFCGLKRLIDFCTRCARGLFCVCERTTHRIWVFVTFFGMSVQRSDHDLCSPMIDLLWLCSTNIIFITIANWTRCWRLLPGRRYALNRHRSARIFSNCQRVISGGYLLFPIPSNKKTRSAAYKYPKSKCQHLSQPYTFSWHHRSWPDPVVGPGGGIYIYPSP